MHLGPHVAEILAAKGGSATTLMEALLIASKVQYQYAMAGLSPDVDSATDWEHPEPFQFARALLRVQPRDGAARWVNPQGAKYSPMSALPAYLWGAPVFVCDGAVFPTSGAMNPTLTIMATALRNARHFA